MTDAPSEQHLRMRHIITCACKQHAIVRLDPVEGPPLYVRTSIEMAAAIHAGDIALPSAAAIGMRALSECLAVTGAKPTAAVLARDQREVRLRIEGAAMPAPSEVAVDPGVALLAAKVLRLDIVLAESSAEEVSGEAQTDLPPVFRELLASLDLHDDEAPPDTHHEG